MVLMNRQKAERLLSAYDNVCSYVNESTECDDWAVDIMVALQGIILDAMMAQEQPIITMPTTQPWTGKPIVTYTPYTVTATCSGIDPLFNQVTGGDA